MPEMSPENSKLNEIRELERQLAQKKAALDLDHLSGEVGGMQEDLPEIAREKVRGNFQEIRQENQIESAVSAVKIATGSSIAPVDDKNRAAEIANDAKTIEAMDADKKIQTLSALAWQKGISYSIEVARRLQDPYTLDLLHARLSGEMHDELVKSQKLDDL